MSEQGKTLTYKTTTTVFALSFCTILIELTLSRMSSFYLNYANSFLAIPLTLFGLALGSMRVHLSKGDADNLSVSKDLVFVVFTAFISFTFVFVFFSHIFPITRYQVNTLTTLKTFLFSGMFIFPFYFIGKVLTIFFAQNRHSIGRLYGIDLLAAALGCFATPLMFHFVDLPYLIAFALLILSLSAMFFSSKYSLKYLAAILVVNGVFLGLFVYMENGYELSGTIYQARKSEVTELQHRWNEFSRVSLLKVEEDTGKTFFKIIHDNAESNVNVTSYNPERKMSYRLHARNMIPLPFELGREVKNVLVMFAGCGAQMVEFYDYTDRKASVTGVEINPLVKDFAEQSPMLADYHLKEFYDSPGINLCIQEGRSYLDNDDKKYDVIFAASDAPTLQYKTGHSRKYLDTTEAMRAYVDHLSDDGLLIFENQPSVHKIESLKTVFAEKGVGDLADRIAVFSMRWGTRDTLAISLKPFTDQEISTMQARLNDVVYYLPGHKGNKPECEEIVTGSVRPIDELVTDDRPYVTKLDFRDYEPFPALNKLSFIPYYRNWIKITTMVVVISALLLALVFLYVLLSRSRTAMPPGNMLVYLLITGFCYMLCEITYIAKLELFIGNPLYSMSLLLSVFLMANGVGSYAFDKIRSKINMRILPLIVAAIILVTMWLMDIIAMQYLGAPLIVKIPVVIVLIWPAAFCLGLFYPYVVTWLSDNNMARAVPITYGLSTLSSVVGATYAMTMIINVGYRNMILQAVAGYIILFVFTVIYDRLVPSSG